MRIAALQMQAEAGDSAANLALIDKAARAAKEGGAALLIAPELALPGYGAGEAMRTLAEPQDGRDLAALRATAATSGLAILAGFAERDGDTVYNSAVFTDGARTQVYRKAFLYGDYEKRLFAAAAPTACMVEHGELKIGVLICYDVEFPENVRRLAEAGADLVAVPTALPATGHAAFISGSMIPVRAFENQVHLAYVNHCGADANFAYAGLSRIAAPDGQTLAVAGTSPVLLFAEIEPAAFAAAREANPYLEDLARSRHSPGN